MNLNQLIENTLEQTDTSQAPTQSLDEGFLDTAKQVLGNVGDFFKKKYNAIKVGIVKLMNKTFYSVFRKNSAGVSNGKNLVLDIQQAGYGGDKNNVLAISINTDNIRQSPSAGTNESILFKMKKELFEEEEDFDSRYQKSSSEPGAEGYVPPRTQNATISSTERAKGRNFDAIAGQSGNFAHIKDRDKVVLNYGLSDNFTEPKEKNILSADEVMELIRRLGYQLKFRTSLKQFVPSILIFGKPGQGKTFIAKQMAEELGLKLQAIETASVYKEVFGGMPTTNEVHKVVIVGKDGKPVGQFSDQYDDSDAASANPESGEQIASSMGNESQASKGKNIDPATGKRRYNKKTKTESVNLDYLINAGMIVESIDNGEKIVGYKEDIALAKKKYGLIQQYLTGKLPMNESNSLDLQIQAYALRSKLTGEKVPASIRESAAYANYSAICEEAETGTKVTTIERTVFLQHVGGVLPPSGDKGGWLLLLDEFNRDAKNMNAAMNLLLSGSIGTVYFLPLKTVVIVAGNIGDKGGEGEGDVEEVATMTPAMITRLNFVVRYESSQTDAAEYMAHDPGAWDKDVEKERMKQKNADGTTGYGSREEPKVKADLNATEEEIQLRKGCMYPSAWVNWTTAYQFFKTGNDYAPLKLVGFQDPDENGTIEVNNRLITRVSENVMSAAIEDWINDNLVGDFTKKDYEKWYKQKQWNYFDVKTKKWVKYNDFVSPINMYLQTYQMHPRYMAIINASLMKDAGKNLQDFINATNTSKVAGKIGGVQHVLISHAIDSENNAKKKDKKDLLDTNFKQMCMRAKISVMTHMVNELLDIGTLDHYEALLKANKVPEKDISGAGGPMLWLTYNINLFCDNAEATRDEIFGLAYSFTKALTELKGASESDKKAGATWEFLKSLAIMLCETDNVVNEKNLNARTWAVEFENIGSSIVAQDYDSGDAPTGFTAATEGKLLKLMANELLVEETKVDFHKAFLEGTRNWIEENIKDISKSPFNKVALQYIREHGKNEDMFSVVLGAIGQANKLRHKSKPKAEKGSEKEV